MDDENVLQKKRPNFKLVATWVPIFIALCALGVSIWSSVWAVNKYTRSSRPYVYAVNYGATDPNTNVLLTYANRVFFEINNAPANIIQTNVSVYYRSKLLYEGVGNKKVRFPDDDIHWMWMIDDINFANIMNRPDSARQHLKRVITIDYTSLYENERYHYELHQRYLTDVERWEHFLETSD